VSCSWHRIGVSVQGTTLTLIFDCKVTDTLVMNRTYPGPKIDTKGIIYVGLHPLASQDEIFEVTIFKSTGKTSNSRET